MNLFPTKNKSGKFFLIILLLLWAKTFLPAQELENLKNVQPLTLGEYISTSRVNLNQAAFIIIKETYQRYNIGNFFKDLLHPGRHLYKFITRYNFNEFQALTRTINSILIEINFLKDDRKRNI